MLPIYDKPMIYYPLSVLMLAGIRQILVISNPKDVPRFRDLLGSGEEFGIELSYAVQKEPRGIAESLLIGEDFLGRDSLALILGDNVFYGHDMTELLKDAASLETGAAIFAYYVADPYRYGVIEFDERQIPISIQEKPKNPKSNWVVTGLYFFDHDAVGIARKLEPSKRGELEITDVINSYLQKGRLKVNLLGRGYAWLDTGTYDSLIDASMFIRTVEERQGLKIGCIEEVAYRMGYINKKQLQDLARGINTDYGGYLERICRDEK